MTGYARARPSGHWPDFPDTTYGVVAGASLELWDQAIYDLKAATFNVKDYGATGDGVTDDTTACQAAISAAIAAGGGIVYFPAGRYIVSTLTYKSFVTFRGATAGVSQVWQKSGTADVLIKSGDTTTTQQFVRFEDLFFSGFPNQTDSLGLLRLEGTTYSSVARSQFTYAKNFALKLLGGATQGDTMYNRIEGNIFQQILSSSCAMQLTPSTQVAGGSHPDGTVITGNVVNGSTGVTGIKIDNPAVDAVGALGADNVQILFNSFIEVPTALDIVGQNVHVAFNRGEVTSGTMAITVQTGTTNFPTQDVVFLANGWPTHGTPGSFIFTNNGRRTLRFADNDSSGTNWLTNLTSGATTLNVRVTGDAADRFAARADGALRWGDGSSATDTTIFRAAAGVVRNSGEWSSLVGSGSQISYSTNVSGDTSRRWQNLADGTQKWGSGTVVDTQISRTAAHCLGMGSGDTFKTGTGVTGSRPAAATVGQGAQWFDATLGKPIWSDGTNWRDAAGTVV